jgi:hypothetical protein
MRSGDRVTQHRKLLEVRAFLKYGNGAPQQEDQQPQLERVASKKGEDKAGGSQYNGIASGSGKAYRELLSNVKRHLVQW